MWLQVLKELKEKSKKTIKQIAEETRLPKRTIERIFLGQTPNPTIATIIPIVNCLGCNSLDEVFAETNVVLGTKSTVELQNELTTKSAELDLALTENKILDSKVNSLLSENELLKMKLLHTEELLAVHNYYSTKQIKNNNI